MGAEIYRGRYDPLAALANAPSLMHMDLVPDGPNRLSGPYYIDGAHHPYRRDKLKVFISRGSVWVYEEGGKSLSLPQWLIDYGGASNFKEALSMINSGKQNVVWIAPQRDEEQKEVRYVETAALRGARGYDLNTCALFRWMCGMFPEEKVRFVWDRYNVTTDSHGNAVFWVVDKDGRILYDKRIYYKEDGHRDKDFFPSRQYRVRDGYTGRCFFGDCVPDDGKKAFLVESEKSALLGALYYDRRFLATGGKSNLRDIPSGVMLLPDMDAREEWSHKGNVWPWWQKWGIPESEIPKTADIGDMIVYKIQKKL